jgi:superfamily II DNA or RNA helicase
MSLSPLRKQAEHILQRAGVDMSTPTGYSKKMAVLLEHGGQYGLTPIAKRPDGELSRILGPGRLMMKQIRVELLSISVPPAKHSRKDPEVLDASARRLLARVGLSPNISRRSYPRRLAQLLRIGAVYGLDALENATDSQIQAVFGLGVFTERQRELKVIQFLANPPATPKPSISDHEFLQFLLENEPAPQPLERQLRVPKARAQKATGNSKKKSVKANYGWQEKALQAWLKNGRRGVVEAATGSGKTRVGIRIASEFVHQGGCVLIVTPTRDLVEQWITEAEDAQIKVWADSDAELLLQNGTPGIGVVTYARAGTQKFLSAAKAGKQKPQLLVADEAHHLGSDVQGKNILLHTWQASLGLTATLERSDGAVEEINKKIGEVVYRYTVKQAIQDGVLAPFHYVTLGVELEDEIRDKYEEVDAKVRSWAGKLLGEVGVSAMPKNFMKFAQEQKKAGVPGARFAAGMYVSFWNKRRNLVAGSRAKLLALKKLRLETTGVHLLSFAETEPAAQAAAEALTVEPHFIVEFISGSLSKSRRRQLRDAFSDETLAGLVGPKLLDEGINLPEADLGIVLAKSSSNVQLIQRLGRVLRRKKSKRDAVFLTLFANGTYEDPYTKSRNEDKDLRLQGVIEASIEGRPIKLTDSPPDIRKLRRLLTG